MLLQVSGDGSPGTQGCGTPPAQRSIVRRQAPTPQVCGGLTEAWTHPAAASQPSEVQGFASSQLAEMSACPQLPSPLQVSVVHKLASSQVVEPPAWQAPLLHTSPTVHVLPSLQGLLLLVWPQAAVVGLQVSEVQGLASSQAGEPTHRLLVPVQWSLTVQGLWSSQGPVV